MVSSCANLDRAHGELPWINVETVIARVLCTLIILLGRSSLARFSFKLRSVTGCNCIFFLFFLYVCFLRVTGNAKDFWSMFHY